MTSSKIDPVDARLLDVLQKEFPVVSRPFEAIAQSLDAASSEVMSRITALKESRIIRQISAIFDSPALGYYSALASFRVCDCRIDDVAQAVSRHSGVTHCYSRDSDYNLWFTITVGPDKNISAEVDSLARELSVDDYLFLPASRVFKIGVFFGMSQDSEGMPNRSFSRQPQAEYQPISEGQIAAVRALQRDIPITDRPFALLASEENLTEQRLLEDAHHFLKTGMMRRFAAVLRHRHAGYGANAMVCWRVNEEDIEQIGAIMAENPAVSHCYQRPTNDRWPYSLYTMIHARSDESIAKITSELCASSGLDDYAMLHTIKEYKKSRVVYFD